MRRLIERILKAREEQRAREILTNKILEKAGEDVCPLDRLMLAEHGIHL